MRNRPLALILMLAAAFALGCGGAADTLHEGDDAVHDAAEEAHAGDGESAAHAHGMEGTERDEYSMPFAVYDFLEISEGDTVVDLMAGGGYNAERLARVVGAEGHVIAEKAREGFQERAVGGDLADYSISFVGDVAELEDGSVNAVVAIRAYHLFPDVPATLGELHRAMAPGGVVGVVEVRLNEAEGHDMETHRLGEQTVIADFEAAGFEYVGESDMLRRDDDDYSVYAVEGKTRFHTDRMLLKFRKAG